jgi:hypothetical protein
VSSGLCTKKTFPKEKKNASHHKATKNRRFTKKDLCATLCLPVFVRKKLFQRKRKMHLTTKPQRIEGSQKKIFVQLCVFRSLCEKGFSEGKEKMHFHTNSPKQKPTIFVCLLTGSKTLFYAVVIALLTLYLFKAILICSIKSILSYLLIVVFYFDANKKTPPMHIMPIFYILLVYHDLLILY